MALGCAPWKNACKRFLLPGGRADVNSALALTGNLMVPDLDNQVVVITDGAVAADPAVVADVNAPIELLQVGRASAANLAVVQLTARAAGETANETALFARLANFSDSDVDATVSVFANGVEVETRGVPIPAERLGRFHFGCASRRGFPVADRAAFD